MKYRVSQKKSTRNDNNSNDDNDNDNNDKTARSTLQIEMCLKSKLHLSVLVLDLQAQVFQACFARSRLPKI